jgi:hypothetical protein
MATQKRPCQAREPLARSTAVVFNGQTEVTPAEELILRYRIIATQTATQHESTRSDDPHRARLVYS